MRLVLPAGLLLVTVTIACFAADAPRPIPFACRTWFYADVKDLLIPGDVVYAIASRAPKRQAGGVRTGRPEPVWDGEEFRTALSELAAVDMKGIRRDLVLSAYEDLEREIGSIPRDIQIISYNSEVGMTPMAELQNLATYVPKFVKLAHDHGFKMGWGPTNYMLMRSPELFELAKYVDSFGLQHQRPLQLEGVEGFVRLTRERYAKIKSINPNCEVNVQVVLERTPAPQAIEAFHAASEWIDRFGIWTMRDKEGLRAVLESLKDLRQERMSAG